MKTKVLNVKIGQVKVGRKDDVLQALLGSCIGIGFLDKKREIYGLAHCLLSQSPNPILTIGGRYIDQAIFSLLKLMNIGEEGKKNIEAVLVGGGNMTMPAGSKSDRLIGQINSDFAMERLEKEKIKIVHNEISGNLGRKVFIDCKSGTYTIIEIPRLKAS